MARAAASELSLFFELLEQFPPVASKPRLHNVVFFQKLQNTCCFQNTWILGFHLQVAAKAETSWASFCNPHKERRGFCHVAKQLRPRKEGLHVVTADSCQELMMDGYDGDTRYDEAHCAHTDLNIF